jgi:hypothetical protein
MKSYEDYVHKVKQMTTGGTIDVKKLNDINKGKIGILTQKLRKLRANLTQDPNLSM